VVASTSSDDLVAGLLLALSYDQGEDWQDVWVDLGSYGDFRFSPKFAASSGTLLVATRACCLLPGVELGVPITTADGRTWSMGPTLASPADAVVALPDGFMALNGADGRTQLSPDGNSWFDGPTLRSVEGVYFELAAAGPLGVVIVPTGAGIRARHVRFAPADRLDPGAWTTPAEKAEEPQIGEAYPVRLFGPIAQCDRRAYQILMDARAWVPTADAPFRDLDPILEDGTVSMLTEDTAIYENPQGVSVAFEAVHPPPPYINCPY